MKFMKSNLSNSKAWLSLSVLVSTAVAGSLSSAQADEVIWRSREISKPAVIYTPPAVVTTKTTTVESSPTVVQPAVPPLAADTISRSTMIIKESPARSRSSSSVSLSTSLDNLPYYRERLRLMSEQIDNGIAKGWITSDRARQLRNELADLEREEVIVRNNGYLKLDCDSFEKRLTGFNIELSQSLQNIGM